MDGLPSSMPRAFRPQSATADPWPLTEMTVARMVKAVAGQPELGVGRIHP